MIGTMSCASDQELFEIDDSSSSITTRQIGEEHSSNPWTKSSKQKPRRPLNPYQRFFREERARYLGLEPQAATHAESDESKGRRRHRKTHGKISFKELSCHVSREWRLLDANIKKNYQKEFKQWMEQYKIDLEEYKATVNQGQPETSKSSLDTSTLPPRKDLCLHVSDSPSKILMEKSFPSKIYPQESFFAAPTAAGPPDMQEQCYAPMTSQLEGHHKNHFLFTARAQERSVGHDDFGHVYPSPEPVLFRRKRAYHSIEPEMPPSISDNNISPKSPNYFANQTTMHYPPPSFSPFRSERPRLPQYDLDPPGKFKKSGSFSSTTSSSQPRQLAPPTQHHHSSLEIPSQSKHLYQNQYWGYSKSDFHQYDKQRWKSVWNDHSYQEHNTLNSNPTHSQYPYSEDNSQSNHTSNDYCYERFSRNFNLNCINNQSPTWVPSAQVRTSQEFDKLHPDYTISHHQEIPRNFPAYDNRLYGRPQEYLQYEKKLCQTRKDANGDLEIEPLQLNQVEGRNNSSPQFGSQIKHNITLYYPE